MHVQLVMSRPLWALVAGALPDADTGGHPGGPRDPALHPWRGQDLDEPAGVAIVNVVDDI